MDIKRQVDDIIDVRFFVFKLITNWYYFLITILLALSIAFGVNRYSQEVYYIDTTLLIKENTGSMASNAAEMLYDNTYHSGKRGLKNEEIILKSSPLIYETVEGLGFDVSYFVIGNIKTTETYNHLPFKIINPNPSSVLHGESFTLDLINNQTFKIFDGNSIKEGTYSFGNEIPIKGTTIKILSQFTNTSTIKNLPNYNVRFSSLKTVVKQKRD